MKRIKKLIPLLLLVIFGYCMPVSAEETKDDSLIQWKTDEEQVSAELTLRPDKDMVESGAAALQITMQVMDTSGNTPGVTVAFDETAAASYRITDYTYNTEKKELNIFLSDTKPLFDEEEQSYVIGTVQISTEAEDYEISIVPLSVKTVSQSRQTEEWEAQELQDMKVTFSKGGETVEPEEPEKPGGSVSPETTPVFDNASDVVNELYKGSASEVVYQIGADGSLSKEEQKVVFEALKGKDKAVTFAVKDGERLLYSFTFRGDQLDYEYIAVDMKLTVGENNPDIEKLMHKDGKNLILSFAHHGKLPGRAEVKVYVGGTYADGQELYLYYYNPETKAVEPVQKDIVVVDGYVAFELAHCSDYVLTTKEIKEAGAFPVPGEQTPSGGAGGNNDSKHNVAATGDKAPVTILIVVMAAAVVAIAAVIWRKLRK